MPPIVIAAAVAGTATVVASAVSSRSQRKAAEKASKQQSLFASQAKKINEQREEEQKVLLAEDRAIAERQLAITTQRENLETLAVLKQLKARKKPVIVSSAPQPVRQPSFIDKINSFFERIF